MNSNENNFQNLNEKTSKKNTTNMVLILELVVSIIVIGLMVVLVIGTLSKKKEGGSDTKTLVCTKDGKRLDQTIQFAYQDDKIKSWSVEYRVDTNVDEDTLSTEEQDDLIASAFSQLAFAQYEGTTGIQYSIDDTSKILKTKFSIDFEKVSSTVANELMPDDEKMTYQEALDFYKENGYTCK